MRAMPVAIELQAVTRTYMAAGRTPVRAVDDVSLSVPAGQVLGLLGPSGAGKTTLLRMLACLDSPTEGRVLLNGYDAVSEHAAARQQVHFLGHDDGPPIALVDEPAPASERLRVLLRTACAQGPGRARRQTVVVATREAAITRDLCDRVAILHRGRLLADVSTGGEADLSRAATYEITVKGRLDARRETFFDGLVLRSAGGTTTISGPVVDQAALHGLLLKVRDLGLPLLSVTRDALDLEGLMALLEGRRHLER
jgi:ABC-type multidrug transport system ATPase subunit